MKRIHLVITALAILGISVPAMAQNNGTSAFSVPVYNSGSGPTYYTTQPGTNNAPIYNNANNAPPMPMQQMVAGVNAPSYNFNGGQTQPFQFNTGNNIMSGVTSIGSLSPEQAAYVQAQAAQQNQMANASQNSVFGGTQAQTGMGQYGGTMYQPQAQPGLQQQMQQQFTAATNNPFGTERTDDMPVKRRVVYKERNNPLVEPKRLFNPDQ